MPLLPRCCILHASPAPARFIPPSFLRLRPPKTQVFLDMQAAYLRRLDDLTASPSAAVQALPTLGALAPAALGPMVALLAACRDRRLPMDPLMGSCLAAVERHLVGGCPAAARARCRCRALCLAVPMASGRGVCALGRGSKFDQGQTWSNLVKPGQIWSMNAASQNLCVSAIIGNLTSTLCLHVIIRRLQQRCQGPPSCTPSHNGLVRLRPCPCPCGRVRPAAPGP
jgi:hypothetical protein